VTGKLRIAPDRAAAHDAAERGATIAPRTACVPAERTDSVRTATRDDAATDPRRGWALGYVLMLVEQKTATMSGPETGG
jgi:hypothetical protein